MIGMLYLDMKETKNVWYLHGLESPSTCPKTDFLESLFSNVYHPSLDYTDGTLFERLLEESKQNKPDVIIGTSMGGYFADALGSLIGVDIVVFNPAFHSRTYEPSGVSHGTESYHRTVVLGMKDEVVDPEVTLEEHMTEDDTVTFAMWMGHRTDLDVFKKVISNI